MVLNSKDLKAIEDKTEIILREAGKYIVNRWDNISKVNYKDARDLATNVDIEVENVIRKQLKKILPTAGFIVEEGKSSKKAEYNWTIDPIDGTKYYVNKTPLFLTQIALLKDNQPILGQVFNPVSKQFFSASLENGANLNGKKIIYDGKSRLKEAIVDINLGGCDEINIKMKILVMLVKNFYRIRVTGNFLFIYAATGAIDASISLNKSLKVVDYAPGIIILKESGIKVDTLSLSNGKKILIAANYKLYPLIEKILRAC